MKLGKITKNLQPTLIKAGGAIAGSYAQKLIPFGSDKVKAGVVMLGGLLLSGTKGAVGQIGEGMAIGAALGLAKSFGIGGGGFISGGDFIAGIDDLYAGGDIISGTESAGDPYDYNNSYA